MSGNTRRTGLEFNATGNFEKKLLGYIKQLGVLDKAIAKTHKDMDKGPRGAAGQSAALKNAREEAKMAVLRQQTESKIAGIRGKESAKAEVERQREQQANLKTMGQRTKANSIAAKGAADARMADEKLYQFRESKISKLARTEQTHLTRITQLRAKGDRDAEIGAERIIQAKARTIAMEERLRRQEQRRFADERSADQHRAQAFRERLQDTFGGGNLYGTGQQMVGGGVGVLRAMAALPRNEAFHHYAVEKGGWASMGIDKKVPGATQMGLAAAEALRQRVPGMNMSGALDTVKDLQLITGDIHEATNAKLLDQMGKFRVGMQTTYHLTDGQTYNAMKAADMLIQSRPGMSQEDRMHQLQRNTDLISQATAGSGGKVKPDEVYGLLKQAKANRFTLSPDGFRNLMPGVAELGGQRAGTEFTAFSTNVSGGRMPAFIAQNWDKLGLVRKGQVEYTDKGKFARIKAGGFVDSDLLYSDPVAWLKKNVFPKAAKMSAPQAKAFFGRLSGRVTTEDFMASNFFQRGQFDKDAASYKNAPGAAGLYDKQDPYLKADNEYNKAMDTLHTKMAIVVLPGLTRGIRSLTYLLEGLNTAIEKHPTLAKVGAGATAVAAGGAALAGVGLMAGGVAVGAKYLFGGAERAAASAAGEAIGGAMAGGATRTFGSRIATGIPGAIAGIAGKGLLVGAALGVGVLIGNTIRDGIMSTEWGKAIEDKVTSAMAYAMQAVPGMGGAAAPATLPGGLPASGLGRGIKPRPAGGHLNPYFIPASAAAPAAGGGHTVVVHVHPGQPHKTTATVNGKPAGKVTVGHIPSPHH